MRNIIYLFILSVFYINTCLARDIADNITKIDIEKSKGLLWKRETEIIDLLITFKNPDFLEKVRSGVAILATNLINLGSEGFTPFEFSSTISAYGAKMKASCDRNACYLLIRANKHRLKESLKDIFDALNNTNLTEENFIIAKNQAIEYANASIQSNEFLANYYFNNHIFQGTPYECNLIVPKKINDITKERVIDFLKILRSSYVEFAIVGNLDKALISKHLGSYFKSFGIKPDTKRILPKSYAETLFVKSPVKTAQSIIYFSQKSLLPTDKNYLAFHMLVEYIGGHGLDSKLMQKLREQMNITYGVYLDEILFDRSNLLSGKLSTGSKNIKEILDAIKDVFREAANCTQKDLEFVKKTLKNRQNIMLVDNYSMLHALAFMQQNGLNKSIFYNRDNKIDSVTLEQVREVANTILNNEFSFTVYS